MSTTSPFVDLIQNWPARDGKTALESMSEDLDAPYQTVAAWKRRGAIPAERWPQLIEIAKQRGLSLDLETLHAWPRGNAA